MGHTERPGVSRMTIVSSIGDGAAHRVEANIYKLVNVLSVEDVTQAIDGFAQPGADQGGGVARSRATG